MGGVSLGMSLLGLRTALAVPEVRSLTITKANLHAGLEGLKIAQISDLHLSSTTTVSGIQALVDKVLAEEPDLIAVTGDLVDGPRQLLQEVLQPLEGLKAPLGVHYVTGNHEYFWGAEGWISDFKRIGFEVLENAHRVVSRNGANLMIVGINDPTAGRVSPGSGPDLQKALWGAPGDADFRLFLAHQPSAWPLAEAAQSDLMLAGHTHGGQFLPFPGLVSLFHKYFKGLYRHNERLQVYVSPGSGFWGPPNRLGVPPEITLITLKRA
jgi:predicted MPP superfamily phosphohydrolase